LYFNKYKRYGDGGAYNDESSPYRDWYKFRSYPYDYESWWGIEILPKLNHQNENCRRFFTGEGGIIQKYLRRGIAGWRLDVADELSDEFLDELRAVAKETNEDAVIIGEVWENAADKVSYGQRRRYFQGRQLDSVMNYPLKNAIVAFCQYGDGQFLYDTLTEIYASYPMGVCHRLMNLLGTHDTERILTRLAGAPCGTHDRQWQSEQWLNPAQHIYGVMLERMAATMQYTLPGFPSLYYGDEAGMEGYKDPFNRRGMTWDNINTDLHAWYTWLGHLRRTCPLLKHGQFVPVSGAQGCVAYARMDVTHPDLSADGDAIVIIANRNGHEIDYYLPEELSDLVPIMNVEKLDGRCVRIGAVMCAILGRGAWTLSEPMEEPDKRPDRFKDV
jgi:glycosidase